MVLLIDNYDSFTFNLAQYLGELGAEVSVRRNDQITLDEIAALAPSRIVISPGPGRPEDAGISIAAIQPFPAARYHSLVVSEDGWPPVLEIAARTKDGDRTVMALRHREWPMHGVQFHPESILTEEGRRLLRNFLEL